MNVLHLLVSTTIVIQLIRAQILDDCVISNKYLPIPLAQYQLAYFQQNNTVYIFGGISEDYSQKIYRWNLNNITKQPSFQLTNVTTPTNRFTSITNNVVVINNYAYFIGINDLQVPSGKIYRFNINTESFVSDFAAMPIKAEWGCLETNSTHIFMVGGSHDDMQNVSLNVTQVYDTIHNKWSVHPLNISPLNKTGILGSMCVMLNNTLYIFGGNSHHTVYRNIYKIQWPENHWTFLGNLSVPLTSGAIVNHCNVNLIISGGITNGKGWVSDKINIFNVNESKIINPEHEYKMLPQAEMTAFIIHNKMYIFGGGNNNAASQEIQMCSLDNNVCGISDGLNDSWFYLIFVVAGILMLIILIVSFLMDRTKRLHTASVSIQNFDHLIGK
eukprot:189325_1